MWKRMFNIIIHCFFFVIISFFMLHRRLLLAAVWVVVLVCNYLVFFFFHLVPLSGSSTCNNRNESEELKTIVSFWVVYNIFLWSQISVLYIFQYDHNLIVCLQLSRNILTRWWRHIQVKYSLWNLKICLGPYRRPLWPCMFEEHRIHFFFSKIEIEARFEVLSKKSSYSKIPVRKPTFLFKK